MAVWARVNCTVTAQPVLLALQLHTEPVVQWEGTEAEGYGTDTIQPVENLLAHETSVLHDTVVGSFLFGRSDHQFLPEKCEGSRGTASTAARSPGCSDPGLLYSPLPPRCAQGGLLPQYQQLAKDLRHVLLRTRISALGFLRMPGFDKAPPGRLRLRPLVQPVKDLLA